MTRVCRNTDVRAALRQRQRGMMLIDPYRAAAAPAADPDALALYNARVSYWQFEENDASTTFIDSVGSHNLTVRNNAGARTTSAATTAAGLVARGFNTNDAGSTGYIPAGFKLPNSDWSIGLWAYALSGAVGSSRFLLGNIGSAATEHQAFIALEGADDQWHYRAVDSSGTTVGIDSGINYHGGSSVWTLLCGSLDRTANQIVFRVRRVGGGTTKMTAAFTGALRTTTTTANFCVNDALSSGTTYFAGDRHFPGSVDQAFYFSKAVTDSEFDYLYNAGAGRSWASLVSDAGF
jgi:hypothetical protein